MRWKEDLKEILNINFSSIVHVGAESSPDTN
jgi:hypothetical protein